MLESHQPPGFQFTLLYSKQFPFLLLRMTCQSSPDLAHACDLRTWEAEAGRPGVQDQLGLSETVSKQLINLKPKPNKSKPSHKQMQPCLTKLCLGEYHSASFHGSSVKGVCSQVSGLLLSSFPVSVNPSLGTSHPLSSPCTAPLTVISQELLLL